MSRLAKKLKKGKITQEEYDRATAIFEKKSYGDEDDDLDSGNEDHAIIREHEMRKRKAKKRHKKASRGR